MSWHSKARPPVTMIGVVALAAGLALSAGCTEPELTQRPRVESVAHPPSSLDADQQRVLLDGLAVTLTATSEPPLDVTRSALQPEGIPLKGGYSPLYLEVEVLNTTESTVTIGSQSWPVLRDEAGSVLEEPLGYSAGISSRGGPYWGHGGPPPGRRQHSDFAPGGTLTLRMPRQVPVRAEGLNLTWSLDEDRLAEFDIGD